MAPISKPIYPYGTYFQRNYREGERIEVCDLPDWDWDISKEVVDEWIEDAEVMGVISINDDWDDDAKRKQLIENTPKEERVPSDWISWKNHRLRKRGFYNSKNNRTKDVDEAPPRVVLREKSYSPNLKIPLKMPGPDFPTSGHLEFKIWLQHKVEQVALGRSSPRVLHEEGRKNDELEARDSMDDLSEMIRGILNEDLLEPKPGKKLVDEQKHINLMLKIIGRKTGAFTLTDPYFEHLSHEQILLYLHRKPDFLDIVCRQIVKVLIAESKTTSPSVRKSSINRKNRKIYTYRERKEFLRHAKKNGVIVTDDEVKKEIESNFEFRDKEMKFSNVKFNKWIERVNKNNELHSKTAKQMRKLLKAIDLKTGGDKAALRLRLFIAEYEDDRGFELTIQRLELEQIDPPNDWQYAEVETAAIIFVEKLNKVVEEVILEAIEKVREIVTDPTDHYQIRDDKKKGRKVGLTVSETKELEGLLGLKWDADKNQYVSVKSGCFGNWNFDSDASFKEASCQNIKKTINSIIVILQSRGLIQFESMDKEQYRQHFSSSTKKKQHQSRGRKAEALVIHFTQKLLDEIGKSEYTDFKKNKEHAIYRFLRGETDRWMYSPPQRHEMNSPPKGGGFLVPQLRGITSDKYHYLDEVGTPLCKANAEIINALNALQETQWEINLHLLRALFEIKLEGGRDLSDYPVSEWGIKAVGLIEKIHPKPKFRSVYYGSEDAFSEQSDHDEFKRGRAENLKWTERIINHNANVFWHAWETEFRGRLQPKSRTLSPQKDDLGKAMIRFKHWKPLGDTPEDRTGIDWIHIHVHNMMEDVDEANGSSLWKQPGGPAMKKQTFETRVKWVEENLDQLRQMARFPVIHREVLRLDRRRPGGGDIYQRLAALLELDRAYTEYGANGEDWSKVLSGQPVYLDATCNGYQHASTILRNHELARLVNVVGDSGQRPNDLYAVVAKAAEDKSSGDTKKKTVAELKSMLRQKGLKIGGRKSQLVERLYDAIPLMRSAEAVRAELENFLLDKDRVDIAIKQIFSRSVAKKPTMISAYGSTKSGLRKCFHGRGQDGPAAYWDSNKTSREKKEDEKKLERMEKKHKITQKYRDICRRMYDSSTNLDEKWRLTAKLQDMAKNKNLSDGQFSNYKKYLKETRRLEIWNEESSLRIAILGENKLHGSQYPSTKEEGFNINLKKHISPKQPLSPLYVKFLDKRARRQNKLTKLVCDAYYDAIEEVTGRAFVALLEDLGSVANDGVEEKHAPRATQSKGDGLWPGVQWHLPQDKNKGFQVNNYYIKPRDASKTRADNPFRPESVFNSLLPEWYTVQNSPFKGKSTPKKSNPRIKQSMEDEWGSIPEVRKRLDDMPAPPAQVSRKRLYPILDFISKQNKGKPSNVKRLNEIREILGHRNISLTNYEDEEWLRILHSEAPVRMQEHKNDFIEDFVEKSRAQREVQGGPPWTSDDEKKANKLAKDEYRKGELDGSLKDWITNNHKLGVKIVPNFIQSLDAYHMRRVINQCRIEFEDLSFWAVHDAFGTHARDVGTMAKIVNMTFYDIHHNLKLNGWISPRIRNLRLKDIQDSEYIIN